VLCRHGDLSCCVSSENESHIPLDAEVRLIYGIVGVIRLLAGNSFLLLLIPSVPAVPNCCCSKGSAPYWFNPVFLIFQSWVPERPNVKNYKWWVRQVWQSVNLNRIGGEMVKISCEEYAWSQCIVIQKCAACWWIIQLAIVQRVANSYILSRCTTLISTETIYYSYMKTKCTMKVQWYILPLFTYM